VGTSYLDLDRYIDDLLPMTAFDFLAGAITVVAIVLLASILNPYVCISFVHGIDSVFADISVRFSEPGTSSWCQHR
jgi:hypothetical protein